ncbi:MAG TPA: methyl-accepting chemotaxis protein [Usitatibacter sp.]|nr:methyl-accepting chemotaxis protein [Usitatibacter sp.]
MLSKLSVRARLAILLAFVNGLLLVAAGYSWYAIARLSTQMQGVIETQNQEAAASDLARKAQVDYKKQVQEWKDILLRGYEPEELDNHKRGFEQKSAAVKKSLAALKTMVAELGVDATLVENALTEHEALDGKYAEALKAYKPSDAASAFTVDKMVRGIDRGLTDRMDVLVKAVQDRGDAMELEAGDRADRERKTLIGLLFAVALCTVLVSTAWGTATILGITRRLKQASQAARTVASGDLSSRIEVGRDDELGDVLRSLADMNSSLAEIVNGVRESAEKVTVASSQIAAGNSDLSSRTEEQASNLEETAASIEEMTATVSQNAQSAAAANELAAGAAKVAQRGGSAVDEVVKTMQGIQDSSRRIADIIGVIDSIAFQTNILALNAAVEAARAGEQGRGFAVVAGEVRNLAQRSAEAAREIKGLITDSVQRVDAGARLAGGAGSTMGEIVASVSRVSQLINEIATATAEQSSGIVQANSAVAQLDKVTQQNAALVEESTAASESLRQLAVEMSHAVSVFKLGAVARTPAIAAAPAAPAIAAPARAPALAQRASRAALPSAKATEEWTEF